MKRIQRKRTKGWRMPKNCVYVGRGSKWGNPYRGPNAAKWFREDLEAASYGVLSREAQAFWRNHHPLGVSGPFYILAQSPVQLGGKDVCCWCKVTDDCHGDVLIELAKGKQ